nr:NADP-dependent glyceraldehyde-3-phosphate dehydrogenase [Tanacetum cinerariifolium]
MESAKAAQKSWAKTPLWKRAELLHKAAAILKDHKKPIADCLVKEIAKPAKDAATEPNFSAGKAQVKHLGLTRGKN